MNISWWHFWAYFPTYPGICVHATENVSINNLIYDVHGRIPNPIEAHSISYSTNCKHIPASHGSRCPINMNIFQWTRNLEFFDRKPTVYVIKICSTCTSNNALRVLMIRSEGWLAACLVSGGWGKRRGWNSWIVILDAGNVYELWWQVIMQAVYADSAWAQWTL